MSPSSALNSGGTYVGSPVLRTGHGTPAPPHSQASARLLNILNGRSGCVSQTQPVRSQSDDPTLMEEVELQEAAK